jgi:ATP-binding cassette subfamily B protein
MTQASDTGNAARDRPGGGAALTAALKDAAARRPKQRDMRPLVRLLPYAAAHKPDAAAACVFLVISTSASLGLTGAARMVIDKGLTSVATAAIDRYFLLLMGVAVVLALATALRYFFVTKLGERVVADLRTGLYRHIMGLDQAFFLNTRTGEVLSRLTTDIAIIETMLTTSVSLALRNLLSVIGAITLLLFVSPSLTSFVVILAPLVIAPIFIFGRAVKKRSIATQDQFAAAMGYAGESLDALDTVQAFGREQASADRFSEAVNLAFQTSLTRIASRAAMTAVVIILVFGGVTVILWTGAHRVIAHTLTAGALVQFALLSIIAAGAVGALGEVWGDLQKASGAMARISEILDARPTIAAPAHPVSPPRPTRGDIEFRDVTFAYPGREDTPALRGFSLHVRPGETVALVGPSGAGKSTVLRLLLRFYDPQSGDVRIDGVRLIDMDPKDARAEIALVAQDASLFSGSASDNIRFGRAGATDDDIRQAARAAEAEGFLDALPQGFETLIGERAKTLSGGQRQRLAIARALVRNAPILLLDEATSALDAENERLVQHALSTAMSGRTTLVIAHRLATVLKADRIVVVDQGRVVEQGTHGELVLRGGLYARLAQMQFGLDAA